MASTWAWPDCGNCSLYYESKRTGARDRRAVLQYLLNNDIPIQLTCDHGARPDAIIDCGTHLVAIEIEINQVFGPCCGEEMSRMVEAWRRYGPTNPCVFIRINLGYYWGVSLVGDERGKRLETLLNTIKDCMAKGGKSEHCLRVIYLYYDDWPLKESPILHMIPEHSTYTNNDHIAPRNANVQGKTPTNDTDSSRLGDTSVYTPFGALAAHKRYQCPGL